MRLQEIYSNCKRTLNEWSKLLFSLDDDDVYTLQNSESVVQGMTALSSIPFFEASCKSIIQTMMLVEENGKDGKYDVVTKYRLEDVYNALYLRVDTLVGFFETVGYQSERVGIDIKLPPDITLEGLSRCAKDLHTVFTTCPILKTNDGRIEFREVDVGSIWLGFAVVGGVTAILGALAALVDMVVRIRSHAITTKQQEEILRSMKLGNDVLQNYIETNNTIVKEMLEKASENLAKEYNILDPEEQVRLKFCLELLYDWQKKGMEIYPSLPAPEEIKAVFPPMDIQALPTETMKLLLESAKKKEE